MFRPEDFAELLFRLRPIGLALRATPAAPNRKGNIFFMARPPLFCEEGNVARAPRISGPRSALLQQLRPAPKRIDAELLFDLVDGMAQFFFVAGLPEKGELLRILAVAMEIASGDSDQSDFPVQRKLR